MPRICYANSRNDGVKIQAKSEFMDFFLMSHSQLQTDITILLRKISQ
ncbi:hypothetical protein [Campylobacter troglodytis]|nr:hypothetical protein [Campylobacter troglodytis]